MSYAGVGTGATLTLGTNTYTVDITAITQADETMPVLDTSHLGTTGSRSKIVGLLKDHGSVSFDAFLDSSLLDSMKTVMGVSQTVSIKFPLKTGQSTQATSAGTGAITAHNYTVPLEDTMKCNFTITWLGAVTYTDGS